MQNPSGAVQTSHGTDHSLAIAWAFGRQSLAKLRAASIASVSVTDFNYLSVEVDGIAEHLSVLVENPQ